MQVVHIYIKFYLEDQSLCRAWNVLLPHECWAKLSTWWPAASLFRLDRAALSEALNSQKLCLSRKTMFNTSHNKLKDTNDSFHCYHWISATTRGYIGSYVPTKRTQSHRGADFMPPFPPTQNPGAHLSCVGGTSVLRRCRFPNSKRESQEGSRAPSMSDNLSLSC